MSDDDANLPLRARRFDVFFLAMFANFAATSATSDLAVMLGVPTSPTATNPLGRANYWYAHDTDPLFLAMPMWFRLAVGLSTFVYGPFYLVLVWAFWKGRNAIQLPAVVYASMISVITGVLIVGVEFFGEPAYRCQNPAKFLSFNLPYVVVPLLLIARMRAPRPFARRF